MGPEGDRAGMPTQVVNFVIMSGIAPKQNAFKFKIAPLKQICIVKNNVWQEDEPPWSTGPNDKSVTAVMWL